MGSNSVCAVGLLSALVIGAFGCERALESEKNGGDGTGMDAGQPEPNGTGSGASSDLDGAVPDPAALDAAALDAAAPDAALPSADGGSDAAIIPGPAKCTDVELACEAGSSAEDCAEGLKVVVDTTGPTPTVDTNQFVFLTSPSHSAKLSIRVGSAPVDPTKHSVSCTVDGSPVACNGPLTVGPLADVQEHVARVEVTTLATSSTCVVSRPVVSVPLTAPGASQLPTYEGSYMLASAGAWEIQQENEHVFVGTNAVLGMQGKNYCIHRKSPAACRIVVDDGGLFIVSGSNVNTTNNEIAKIVLGAQSVTAIRGSNFFPELSIVPGARIYTRGSNIDPKKVTVVSPFTLSSCPFSTTGSCPGGMVTF